MLTLLTGLLLFLGVHSTRIFADDWRTAQIAKHGILKWKTVYALLSLIGLWLIVVGYSAIKAAPEVLWVAPVWSRHLAALLTLPAFILLVATYLPASRIKAKVGHPMLLAVKLWAVAHLVANGTLAALLLFGSFLVWSVVDFAVSRRRDRRLGVSRAQGTLKADILVIVVGLVLWKVFALYLHVALFGVKPFG
ncbi:MAG: NnrU family protein [Methylophaga sp.]|nr:NnrU family protein [Methylophaga sp.]